MQLFLVTLLCARLFIDEELAIRMEDLPKNPPTQELIETPEILIPDAEGLLILGPGDPVYDPSQLRSIEGTDIRIAVPGNKKTLEQKLTPLYYHQKITPWTIQSIKETIYAYYQEQGRPFILVEVPAQDYSSNVLQLKILESQFDTLTITGQKWSRPDQITRWLDLQKGEPINESVLLDRVRFINRNPYRRATVVYKPGKTHLTTDVSLEVNDQRAVSVYAGTENTGVQWTGRQRWIGGLVWANAFRQGHLFSFQYTASSDFHRFQAWTAQYIAYTMRRHIINVYGGYSSVHAHVPGSPINHGLSGQASLRYTMPLRSIRSYLQDLTVGADWKVMNQTVEFGGEQPTAAKNVNVFELVGTYLFKYENATAQLVSEADLYWSPGKWLPNQSKNDYNALRTGAKPNWVYFHGKFNWSKYLWANIQAQIRFEGQWSSTNLLPSEQLGIGGYNTVRGYEERQLNKDNGIITSFELRLPPFNSPIFQRRKQRDQIVLLGFLDYGYGLNHNAIPGIPNKQHLLGIGPGVRYQYLPHLTGRLDWGWKLHNDSLYGGGSNMVHFSVVGSF